MKENALQARFFDEKIAPQAKLMKKKLRCRQGFFD